ncbi:MAG: hypothetical protein ACRCVV_14810 [Shewanella sp.]|uniref:hypothetical protein n=1 Tax=Aeromonas popoffii TaxID=70856 RepID=UPI003F3A0ABC
MSFVNEAAEAIRNSLVICQDARELEIASNAIIEFCSAFEMDDKEIISALNIASGNSSQEDECIDEIIRRIKL